MLSLRICRPNVPEFTPKKITSFLSSIFFFFGWGGRVGTGLASAFHPSLTEMVQLSTYPQYQTTPGMQCGMSSCRHGRIARISINAAEIACYLRALERARVRKGTGGGYRGPHYRRGWCVASPHQDPLESYPKCRRGSGLYIIYIYI